MTTSERRTVTPTSDLGDAAARARRPRPAPRIGDDANARTVGYQEMVEEYDDLFTELVEHGWGESFHFAPRYRKESFAASIARHQHFLAARLGLRPGMRVLDVGCGIGGPMRHIARFSGAHVVGVNADGYQVAKATAYVRRDGLEGECEVWESDPVRIPAEDDSFDAAYAIESIGHVPDEAALFRELLRVLRPGAQLGAYVWCLTERYDPHNLEHRRIKNRIEERNGVPELRTMPATLDTLRNAGFDIIEHEDRDASGDSATPWYLPLTGEELTWAGARRTTVGRRLTRLVIRTLEVTGKAPHGTLETSRFLHASGDALAAGGRTGIFTPMFYVRARKPA